MDCHMPVMDGFAATKEIRRRQADGKRIPIIALTAAAMNEDRARCLDAGMDDYVSKPVSSPTIRDALDRWVRPRPSVATVPSKADRAPRNENLP
jgi:CheY-like chemotaxis protein